MTLVVCILSVVAIAVALLFLVAALIGGLYLYVVVHTILIIAFAMNAKTNWDMWREGF